MIKIIHSRPTLNFNKMSETTQRVRLARMEAHIEHTGVVQGRALIPPNLTELQFNFPKRALAPRWRWAERQERRELQHTRTQAASWTDLRCACENSRSLVRLTIRINDFPRSGCV